MLELDSASVQIEAKGYKTSSKTVSAKRSYGNLSDADLSLIPKTIEDGGRTLALDDVQWDSAYQEDGTVHYTASATYTGTASSRYATGYTVTATYTGTLEKKQSETVYTLVFAENPSPTAESDTLTRELEETQDESETDEASPSRSAASTASTVLSAAGCLGGIASLAVGVPAVIKLKKKV